jgi:hypothetical protein
VIDPVRRSATHLVIEPRHRTGLGRLVPIERMDSADADIQLRCSLASFEKLELAEHLWTPGRNDGPDGDALLEAPFYDPGSGYVLDDFGGNVDQPFFEDTVPEGDVEVSPHDQVHATDGHLGSVRGVLVEPAAHLVTHVLVRGGHLWRRRDVAVPMSVVDSVGLGVTLSISKEEAARLPASGDDAGAPEQRRPATGFDKVGGEGD